MRVLQPRRRRLGALRTAGLALVVGMGAAGGQVSPRLAVEPTFAYVQEGEPIVLRLDADSDPRWLDAIGTVSNGRLSIAFSDRLEDGVRLAFRLSGNEPSTVRRLVFGDPSGAFAEVDVGELTIVPAVPTGPSPLRRRATVRYGEGAVLAGWRLRNESSALQSLDTLSYASPRVARPVVVVRRVPTDPGELDFPLWLDRLQREVAARAPGGRSASPQQVEDALRTVLPDGALRDPDRLGLQLAPGEAIDVVLTSASFAADLSVVRVMADPLLGGVDPDAGAWQRSLSESLQFGPRW